MKDVRQVARAGLVCASLAATALLAACGSSNTAATAPSASSVPATSSAGGSTPAATGGSTSGSVPKACDLLTQSQAAQLTGDAHVATITAADQTNATTSLCSYADNGTGSTGSAASLLVERVPSSVSQQELQAALSQASHNSGQTQPLSGVGDAGYTEASEHNAGLVFAKGTTIVVLGTNSQTRSGADMLNDVKAFAKQIAGQF